MGITTSLFGTSGTIPKFSDQDLFKLSLYLQVAGVPNARDQSDDTITTGKLVFQNLKCHSCHIMAIKTDINDIPQLSEQEIHPFTDLLLHDMGPELSDHKPEGQASAQEWRTTPLWGLGLLTRRYRDSKRAIYMMAELNRLKKRFFGTEAKLKHQRKLFAIWTRRREMRFWPFCLPYNIIE